METTPAGPNEKRLRFMPDYALRVVASCPFCGSPCASVIGGPGGGYGVHCWRCEEGASKSYPDGDDVRVLEAVGSRRRVAPDMVSGKSQG